MKRYLRPVFITGLFLLAGLFGAGCGDMERGTVVRKVFEPEREYTVFIPITVGQTCSGSGTTQVCTPIMMPFPFIVHDGADWKLRLEEGDKKGWAYVTQADYDRLNVGDYYDREQVSWGYTSDPNNTETRK